MDLYGDFEEASTLNEAILKGDEGEVAKLLDKGSAHLERTIGQYVPLTVAAAYGQLGVARLLVQRGANVNEVGPGGKTAVHWAAEGGHQEVVAFLLSKNARADHADNLGKTPLTWACEGSHAGVVRMLVHYMGRQGKEAGIQAATTALRWAAREGDAQMAKFLLGKGAQAGNGSADHQVTALMEGCSKGRLNVVRLLVQHMRGQRLEDKDTKGRTALYHAARGGHEECSSLFKVKAIPNLGREPLRETIRTVPTKS
jgi:ankyrin repeat protein